jgi:16S rRNA (guanine527-N7)-methyltransferase
MTLSLEWQEKLGVSRESMAKLETYVRLLLEWQQKVNLIGSSTIQDIWHRHILDSLQLAPLMRNESNRSVADLGSGAGLPGLVLAIESNRSVDLYESNNKKAAFLREAIRQTGATARVHTLRLEQLESTLPQHIPAYTVARAVAPLPTLLTWAAPLLTRGSAGFFHKGQDVDAELIEAAKSWKMTAKKHPSITEPKGVILEIRDLSDDS